MERPQASWTRIAWEFCAVSTIASHTPPRKRATMNNRVQPAFAATPATPMASARAAVHHSDVARAPSLRMKSEGRIVADIAPIEKATTVRPNAPSDMPKRCLISG